ncbi:MAG: otsB [Pseudobdellovibrio sp.]|jgi:trehalose 6-phosphate phosphatase|nr:otsB [Pseudobdellovibrio sp.]
MIPLLSKNSLVLLESFSFTRTLYAFDFDGTLAKIVTKPENAFMTKTTESLLEELSTLAPVAIVSGRSINDLKKRVHFNPQFLVGNHGLEGLGNNNASLTKAQAVCSQWVQKLKKMKFESGVEIEEKTYSLALHYRQARNKTNAKKQLLQSIAELTPEARVITGKSVYNLLPPGTLHKGAAMLHLIEKSSAKHAFYIGDDDTDEDIFSVEYSAGQLMTVRVGQKKTSHAKFYIDRQAEINRLLKILIGFHKKKANG